MLHILPSYFTLLALPKRPASDQPGALASPATSLGHHHSCHSPSKQHHAPMLTQPRCATPQQPKVQNQWVLASFLNVVQTHTILWRESFILIHTLSIWLQSLIIYWNTNQASNKCGSLYTILIIVEAGGSNEKLNIPLNQLEYKYSSFGSLYF